MLKYINKKPIFLSIAVIFLVVVTVALVIIILRYSKGFANQCLNKTNDLQNVLCNISGFIFVNKAINIFTNKKIFLKNEDNNDSFIFTNYKIIYNDSNYILNNKKINFSFQIIISNGKLNGNLIGVWSLRFTDIDGYIIKESNRISDNRVLQNFEDHFLYTNRKGYFNSFVAFDDNDSYIFKSTNNQLNILTSMTINA